MIAQRQLILLAVFALLLGACARSTPAATPTPAPSVTTAAPTAVAEAPTATAEAPTAVAEAPTAAPSQASAPELAIPRTARLPYQAGTRSADGRPTDTHWQNTSLHTMKISVAPPSRVVTATQVITYSNNSPYPLSALFLRTYLNVHHPDASRNALYPPLKDFLTDGVQIDEFQVNGEPKPWPGQPNSTVAVVRLDTPLAPKSTISLTVSWRYTLANANGWKEGAVDETSFYLAYFYPRVAVLDDTGNWDSNEFMLGGEFYGDNNDYVFEVTVPRNFVVWATGDLQNPDEVLQPAYAQRLKDSMTSDETIAIASDDELQGGQVTAQTDTVTWKWKADDVRDIAIGLSDRYNWDAGSVVVDPATGRRASVQSAYPDSATLYTTIVEDAKRALVFGSTQWPGVPYPYSKTSIFVGGADEEYPMMVNDSAEVPEPMTVGLVAGHEILHSWFPFYMGTNEARYPFMDEGWTTAFEYLLATDVVGKEQADAIFAAFRNRQGALTNPSIDLPIILPQDSIAGGSIAAAYNQYGKAALAYLALKDLMGDEAFKTSLHEFMARWNGKHPLPWDMFNTFNDTYDEDLTWFFHNWFYTYNYLDIAVKGVEKTGEGYVVQVANPGALAVPFDVVVTYADGTTETLHQTPAVWKADQTATTVQVSTTRDVQSVTLDGGIFPDAFPTDNTWKAGS